MSENHNHSRREGGKDEIFSKRVPAGKRTYFFDLKSTKTNDFFLTITESKRRMGDDGTPFYEKHKIFIYREDFEKFLDGLNEVMSKAGDKRTENPTPTPTTSIEEHAPDKEESSGSSFTDVSFEDLK
jgi:hypothetical protein